MADRSYSSSSSGGAQDNPSVRPWLKLMRLGVYLALIVGVLVTVVAAVRLSADRSTAAAAGDRLLSSRGLIDPVRKRLSPEYSDKQQRLLADPPADPAQLLDPETLVLAHNVDTESEGLPVDWEGLKAHLAKATGKEVVLQECTNSVDDVAAVKHGKIHLIALHSADVPHLVNNAGFIPVAVLSATGGAIGNRLDIAVTASSKITKLSELEGHILTCTRPDSITGYRAAVAVLLQEAQLRPYLNYTITWSFGQSESIRGLAAGNLEVAAISEDKLNRLLKKERIKDEDYRVIYQSQVIPHLTIGFVHDLRPELANKLLAAVLDFDNHNGTPEDDDKPLRFAAIDYKRDFEFVRKIDDSFDPRFGQRVRANAPAEPDSAQEPDAAPKEVGTAP